ncbi:ankyrin repeat-containing domain protein [Sporodiniella umbellata]|nr:ankyrin repeat-containing domain protein [Sporodiniella umbellata]
MSSQECYQALTLPPIPIKTGSPKGHYQALNLPPIPTKYGDQEHYQALSLPPIPIKRDDQEHYLALNLPPIPTKHDDQEHLQNLNLSPVPTNKNIKDQSTLPVLVSDDSSFHSSLKSEQYIGLQDIIAEVKDVVLQERLKQAMDKVVQNLKEEVENLTCALNDLETEKSKVETQCDIQSQCFKKAAEEVYLYKTRYDHLVRRYSLDSNSAVQEKSSATFGRLSYSSAATSPALDDSSTSAICKPKPVVDDESFDTLSITSNGVETSSIAQDRGTENKSELREAKDDTDILVYAGNSGFWGTIADKKKTKAEVETLISNYLSRGGSANIANGSETHGRIKDGYSLIHALVVAKNTKSLRRIIDAGAKANVFPLTDRPEDKISPLVLAAKVKHMNSIRVLVEKSDADILGAQGPLGESVLHAAIESNSEEAVEYILKASENMLAEKADNNGATPLHYACIVGNICFIALLVKERHVNISCQDKKGATPLHYAVQYERADAVKTLIELGANPNGIATKQMPTPLDLARSGDSGIILECLKRAGAKTKKEVEKARIAKKKSSSIFSGESSGSIETSSPNKSFRHFLQMKTTQILKGK